MGAVLGTALVAVALGAAGCGDDEEGGAAAGGGEASSGAPARIGAVIKGLDNPFFATMDQGIRTTGRERGAEVEVQAAAGIDDTSGQASRLEALVGQDFGCYLVNPISETNLVQPLARVPDGTPIVNIDLPVGGEAAEQAGLEIATYIGTDNVAAGRLAAETMAELVDEGATIGMIGGIAGDPTSAARIRGFTEGAEGVLEPLETVAGNWERQRALTAAEDILRANPDLAGFFAANDQMALGIAQAVRSAGRGDDVEVIGVDGIEDALQAIERGTMTATVSQYPYTIGQLGVEACLAAARGERLPARVDAPVQVVTRENVARAQENFPEPVEEFENPFAELLGG
jgi:ABC-type sugar transport system substrate-binding protein